MFRKENIKIFTQNLLTRRNAWVVRRRVYNNFNFWFEIKECGHLGVKEKHLFWTQNGGKK